MKPKEDAKLLKCSERQRAGSQRKVHYAQSATVAFQPNKMLKKAIKSPPFCVFTDRINVELCLKKKKSSVIKFITFLAFSPALNITSGNTDFNDMPKNNRMLNSFCNW